MGDISLSQELIKQIVDQAVERFVFETIEQIQQDPVWLEKIEKQINQAMTQRVVAGLNNTDIGGIVRERVDENMTTLSDRVQQVLKNQGIQDLADQCELTVLDGHVVVEHDFTAKNIQAVESLAVKDLSVTGTINADSDSWQALSDTVTQKTLDKITDQWKDSLVSEVTQEIQQQGIDFDAVNVEGFKLIENRTLAETVIHSSLKSVGALESLQVDGPAQVYNTVFVKNKRLGVNTEDPEMAVSVWDEEVNIIAGKHKNQTAYLGTGRLQNLTIGVNRTGAIEINSEGITTVKQLRVGVHRVMFGDEVPNWAGTRGDVVFNALTTANSTVFAWQCLGGHKWKEIRAVE